MIWRIIVDNTIDRATNANVTKFKDILIAQFDICTTINKVKNANLAFETLKQKKDNDFYSYYNRTKGFLEDAS